MYRKFSAGNIFNGYKTLDAGSVLVTDTTGVIIDIVATEEAGDGIQYFDGTLCPGFINAHCHVELSHLKNLIPEKTGLVDFVFSIISKRHFNEEDILQAIEKADKDMHGNGIVAVGDICNNAFTTLQKQKSPIRYYNFIETSGFPPSAATMRFENSLGLYKQFEKLFACNSIVPHAPYSVSQPLFALIDNFKNNRLLSIHNQETPEENELFEKGKGDFLRLYKKLGIDASFFKPTGTTSLQTYLPYLENNRHLILVHNVSTTKEDIAFLQQLSAANRQRPVYFCLCPNANLFITSALPDINLLQKGGCNIVIGTDSLASNHQLNILEEIKTLQKHYPALSTSTLLQWATLNGAIALQMDKELGSFEKGKRPGVVLINNMQAALLTTNSTARRIL